MIEIIVEIFAELFLQLIIELIANFGIHAFNFEKRPHPVVASIGYLLLGAVLGAISLFMFKDSFIQGDTMQLVNLFATPVLVGLIMSAIGKVRESRDKEVVRLEKFAYGFLFAFGLALVRYGWAG